MTSPDFLNPQLSVRAMPSIIITYEQIGICIGLSFVSMYNPASFSACTTATLAWNRFIPFSRHYINKIHRYPWNKDTHLEFRPSIRIKCSIVIHNIDELQLMAHADFIIVRIVCRCDLHSTSSELHVDGLAIRDNGHESVDERVASKFAVEMLNSEPCHPTVNSPGKNRSTDFISRVIRMDSNCCITKHGLRTCCRNDNFLIWIRISANSHISGVHLPEPSIG